MSWAVFPKGNLGLRCFWETALVSMVDHANTSRFLCKHFVTWEIMNELQDKYDPMYVAYVHFVYIQ